MQDFETFIHVNCLSEIDFHEIIIIILIIILFQEDNIFGRVASLTYGHQLTNVGMIL